MIETGELKKGSTIEIDGTLYQVIEVQHLKIGRGSAQVRMKLKNVRTGSNVEKTVQAGEKFPRVRLDHHTVQFLYEDDGEYHFMDTETYDQFAVSAAQLGGDARFLKENTEAFITSHEGEVLGVDLPVSVDLVVAATEPGFAGDTATGARKAATLETGLVVQVPLFVNEVDTLRIDTRTGEYQTRIQ